MLKKLMGLYLLSFIVGVGIGKFIIVPIIQRNRDKKEAERRKERQMELMKKMKEEMIAKQEAEEYKRIMENLQVKTTEELVEEIDKLFKEMKVTMDYEDVCETFEESIEN